jgi:hypothetical protein
VKLPLCLIRDKAMENGFERIGNKHSGILFLPKWYSSLRFLIAYFPFIIGNFTLRCALCRIWIALSVSLWRLGSGLDDRGITGLTGSEAH